MNERTEQPIETNNSQGSKAGLFAVVFLMLCGLTGLSFWIANSHLMENQVMGWSAMMAVSASKALLVVMFFMHLWWEKRWKYILTIPALIMGTLLVLLLIPDIGMRTETYPKDRIEIAPAANVDQN